MAEKIKRLDVVTDYNGCEAVYVDGVLVFDSETVYAVDIEGCTGGDPILFRHLDCEFQGEWEGKWPEKLEDVPLV